MSRQNARWNSGKDRRKVMEWISSVGGRYVRVNRSLMMLVIIIMVAI